MDSLEKLLTALAESLQKSGLSIISEAPLSSEYWITADNEYIDASPQKHATIALRYLAPMGTKLREILRQGKDANFDSLPEDEKKKYGEFIEYVKKNGYRPSSTPVDYMINEKGWIRIFDDNIDMFELTDDNVKKIAEFLQKQDKVDPAFDSDETVVVHTDNGMFSAKIGEFMGDAEPVASNFRKYTFGATEELTERVRKIGKNKWRVLSKKGKNLGTFSSKEKAKKHLKDVEYFKHKKG